MSDAVLDPRVLDSLRQLTPPGGPDVLAQVFQLFLEDAPVRIEKLRQAWAAGDAPGVQRAAHSLMGSAGNLGANALLAVCRQIDDEARADDLTGTESLTDALAVEFARVEAEIVRLLRVES